MHGTLHRKLNRLLGLVVPLERTKAAPDIPATKEHWLLAIGCLWLFSLPSLQFYARSSQVKHQVPRMARPAGKTKRSTQQQHATR